MNSVGHKVNENLEDFFGFGKNLWRSLVVFLNSDFVEFRRKSSDRESFVQLGMEIDSNGALGLGSPGVLGDIFRNRMDSLCGLMDADGVLANVFSVGFFLDIFGHCQNDIQRIVDVMGYP